MAAPSYRAAHGSRAGLFVGIGSLSILGFLPLFEGPSYEFSLAAGVLLPTLAAWSCLGRGSQDNVQDAAASSASERGFYAVFHQVLREGARFGLVACVVALLHGLRVGFCDAWAGFEFLLLGPVAGCFAGAAWGAVLGLLPHRVLGGPGRRLGFASSLPLLCIAVSVLRFYTSPMIFAFDAFFGYFSGTLYDTQIDGVSRLLSYRVGTFGWIVAACALVALRSISLLGAMGKRAGGVLALLLGLGVGLGTWWQGPSLGHYQNQTSLEQILGRQVDMGRCQVRYAPGISEPDATLLARECEAHLRQLEAFFEVHFEDSVRVWLFQSADQKAALMGARHVYIAKPWRKEIYIQSGTFPHPVLGHELAHVLAGAFAPGPFRVAGKLGGWIPDPGRIEGFAVAASPSADDELTLRSNAVALLKLGILPSFGQLFQFGFFGFNSSTAYSAVGAVVEWLHQEYGAKLLRAWYAGADLAALTGQSLPELEQRYRRSLAAHTLTQSERRYAAAHFNRPALFARRCPHEVDTLLAEASGALSELDLERAERKYNEVLALSAEERRGQPLSGEQRAARLGLSLCSERRGDLSAAQQARLALANAEADAVLRAADLERSADAALLASNSALAQALYAEAIRGAADEDVLRTLELKELAAYWAADSAGRQALVRLLLGDARLGQNWLQSGVALSEWAEREPEQGVSDYLLGRNLFWQGYRAEAKVRLRRAVTRDIYPDAVRREALRWLLIAACADDDVRLSTFAYQSYEAEAEGTSVNRRRATRSLAARCGVVGALP